MRPPNITTRGQPQIDLIGASLTWKRAGTRWLLFNGKRRMGEVVPDDWEPGMWRIVLSGGRLSDIANLSWARNAVALAAERELRWEADHGPPITRDSGGVFLDSPSLVALTAFDGVDSPPEYGGMA